MTCNWIGWFVLVSLGWVAVVNAEPREANAQGKPTVQVKGQVKAKVGLKGAATSAQKPGGSAKPATKKPAPRNVGQTSPKPTDTPGATAAADVKPPVNSTGPTGSGTVMDAKREANPASAPIPATAPTTPPAASPNAASPDTTNSSTSEVMVVIGGASYSGGNLPNASRVVAGTKKGLLACWDSSTPPAGPFGVEVRVTLTISADGTVSKTKTYLTGKATASTVQCVESIFAKAKFESPEKKAATLTTTVSYRGMQ